MWGILNFLFHLLHQKKNSKFLLFEVFLDQKIISKAVFSSDVGWQKWKNNCMVLTNFLAQKIIGEKYFLKFSVSRNVFKMWDFCRFLVSKIYDKIWHFKDIFWNLWVSENFYMSPVIELWPRPVLPGQVTDEEQRQISEWEEKNEKVLSTIVFCITDEFATYVYKGMTVKELWDNVTQWAYWHCCHSPACYHPVQDRHHIWHWSWQTPSYSQRTQVFTWLSWQSPLWFPLLSHYSCLPSPHQFLEQFPGYDHSQQSSPWSRHPSKPHSQSVS